MFTLCFLASSRAWWAWSSASSQLHDVGLWRLVVVRILGGLYYVGVGGEVHPVRGSPDVTSTHGPQPTRRLVIHLLMPGLGQRRDGMPHDVRLASDERRQAGSLIAA